MMLIAYIVMVFISHFSVYNKTDDYKITDSFNAMLLKTEVPAEFFIYFGLFIFATVLVAVTVNFISKKR